MCGRVGGYNQSQQYVYMTNGLYHCGRLDDDDWIKQLLADTLRTSCVFVCWGGGAVGGAGQGAALLACICHGHGP